jgi:hypothetical protein
MAFDVTPTPISGLIDGHKLVINDGYRAKNSELTSVGLPFARAGNIDGGFDFDGADCFPESELGKVGIKLSQPGDVVFTSKGYGGQICICQARDTTLRVFTATMFLEVIGRAHHKLTVFTFLDAGSGILRSIQKRVWANRHGRLRQFTKPARDGDHASASADTACDR